MTNPKYKKKLEDLLQLCQRNLPRVDESLIRRAFEFGFNAHRHDMRASGEPFFDHPYAVARIVAKEIPLDDISVAVALPAAYAFSRYRFLGDKHLFFWLLSNRMAPPAVFVLPFVQLYSSVGLFDTHLAVALAHTLFNIPLAVWILEGFMSGVPKELDETAYVDGYSFPAFFIKIFLPTISAGIGVAAFFCFMFSWVEMLLAKNLTSVAAKPIVAAMTKTSSASGYELGLLAAAGVLTLIPGAIVIYFVRNYIAKGFALGRV